MWPIRAGRNLRPPAASEGAANRCRALDSANILTLQTHKSIGPKGLSHIYRVGGVGVVIGSFVAATWYEMASATFPLLGKELPDLAEASQLKPNSQGSIRLLRHRCPTRVLTLGYTTVLVAVGHTKIIGEQFVADRFSCIDVAVAVAIELREIRGWA